MKSQQKRRSSPRSGPPDPIRGRGPGMAWPCILGDEREPGERQASQRMTRKGSGREGAACLPAQGPCVPPGHPTHALACDARKAGLTSHLPRRPVSCSRDQMLWMRPACSGWLLVFPQVHWCFSIRVSYTRPAAGRQGGRAQRSPRGTRQLVPLPGERSSGHLPNGQSPRHPGELAREEEMKRQPCPQDSGLSYHRDRADPDSGKILVPNSGLPRTLSIE